MGSAVGGAGSGSPTSTTPTPPASASAAAPGAGTDAAKDGTVPNGAIAGGVGTSAVTSTITNGVGAGTIGGVTAAVGVDMAAVNAANDVIAAQSMYYQMLATQRSMLLQAVRDLCKDAKDAIKDQGEAGHKP